MRTVLLLLLLALAAPASASQTVWKWVDERGVTHYSDRPVPGATKIELNLGSSSSSASTPPPSAPSRVVQPAAPSGPPYRNFEIWKPQNEETFPNTGGQVTVNVRVDPGLQPDHQLYLYLDGRLVEGAAENATSYDLKEVPRGAHSVIAVITDARGTRLQETEPVTFFVRQTSILNQPARQAPPSPPKPRP